MAKTITKKVGKPLSPKPAVEQADTAYLVREDLDEEQEPRMKAAAAGANALTTPTPAASAERSPRSGSGALETSRAVGGFVARPCPVQRKVEAIPSTSSES